jgi:hypothetical protein
MTPPHPWTSIAHLRRTASTSTDPDAIDPTLERKLVAAGADLKSLADVVRRLREHERDVDARATLASEVRRLACQFVHAGNRTRDRTVRANVLRG